MNALPAAPQFRNRHAAGEALARALGGMGIGDGAIILGMPRGGVAVARPVADALRAQLDVIVARKLGVPGLREVSLGAIAEGWNGVVDDSVRGYIGIHEAIVTRIAQTEAQELARRVRLYRGDEDLPTVADRTVVLVDDGLATGATLRAAAIALRARRPARLIAAVPVASSAHCADVRAVVDELLVLTTPEPFGMVSERYDDFGEIPDAEVLRLLGRARAPLAGVIPSGSSEDGWERTIAIPVASPRRGTALDADLGMPNVDGRPRGLVVLAHGGGSSRQSYRNRYLAGRLRMAGWATLRLDLLFESEQAADAADASLRFDVELIARRLQAGTEWATGERLPGADRLVLFGASTGAAAAMITAARRPAVIAGVISRGGRVDLAGDALRQVVAPSLLIVGGGDRDTLRWTRDAIRRLTSRTRLAVIRGAGHTFEEPGTLGVVGERAVDWLQSLGQDGHSSWIARLREVIERAGARLDPSRALHSESERQECT